MTTVAIIGPVRTTYSGALLLVGIVLAALAEAIASTAFSLGRSDVLGDTHATPDEFAWLDVSYIALKLSGFVTAPWLMTRLGPLRALLFSTFAVGLACAMAAMTSRLELLVVLRMIQGFAGGALLVAGQAIIFLVYPSKQQPFLQAIFAIGAVVAPATIAPALQGWLVDSQSWSWIFYAALPVAIAAAGALLMADDLPPTAIAPAPFDVFGFALLSIAFCCLTFVFSQGSRWNWFDEPRIVLVSLLGVASLIAFAGQQLLSDKNSLLEFGAFRSDDFAFAFVVSFVAGAALFGSAFLIPSFAVSVLGFTPNAAGILLLPSGAIFVGALFLVAFLVQARGAPAIAGAPIGILAIMGAMWMLSGSTLESGAPDMGPALLLRGLGLGFLFLAITLIAFVALDRRYLASAIALFNAGRQLGGLVGVAGLQTLIDRDIAANASALSANIAAGTAVANERLTAVSALLQMRGLDPASAQQAAIGLLAQTVTRQATVLAFDTAFGALVLLFVLAAPIVIGIRLFLGRAARRRVGGNPSR
jgi:DHA2 family multidrug resistance protein